MASYPEKKNPFIDDEDIDDDEFLNRPNNYMLCNSQQPTNCFLDKPVDLESKRQELLKKRRELEERSLQSTTRSLTYLKSSEEVGAATAAELSRQREQLVKTEKRLDDINTTLRFSQRHIQGIKSVFGGLKNLISGKVGGPYSPPTKTTEPSNSSSVDIEVVDRNNSQKKIVENTPFHPGLKVRGLYDDTCEENLFREQKCQEEIDKNLDQMLGTITRLKGLSYHLGDEIESQNDLLNKVIDKTESADSSLRKQNRDMKKLLK